MDTLQLLSMLSYAARVGFVDGSTNSYWPWLKIAFLLSALFSLISWWGFLLARRGKYYAQPSSSASFSFKLGTTGEKISNVFADGSTSICRNLSIEDDLECTEQSGHGQRIYMKWACPVENEEEPKGTGKKTASSSCPSNFICRDKRKGSLLVFQDGPEEVAEAKPACFGLSGECKWLSNVSFEKQYGWDRLQALKLGSQWNCSTSNRFGLALGCPDYFAKPNSHCPQRDLVELLSGKDNFVSCVDILWSRGFYATCGKDSTVRLWDTRAGF